ncbi:hypothetical protein ACHAXN_008206 [Cyclotella atomus]
MSNASTCTNVGLVDLLKSPFEQSCSSIRSTVDHLQNAVSSMDLSFDLSNIGIIGPWLDTHGIHGRYELVLPAVQTLLNLMVGMSVSIAFGSLFSVILYYLVVPGQSLSLQKLSVGILLLASSGIIPYLLFDTLQVYNTALRFTICTPFVLYGFKTLEAIFGFVPSGATISLTTYCKYFSAPSELVFDKESGKPTAAVWNDYVESALNIMLSALRISVLVSFLSHYNYRPFGDTNAGEFFDGVQIRHLSLRHLGNCFFIALFFQQALALGDAVIGNGVQIMTGYKVLKSMRNPMLEASSPSDFWGRRWNLVVHSVMKRGVYKPVRKYLDSSIAASLLVFIASGLFHEWLVHAVLIYGRGMSSENVYIGSNSAFFLWNFKVIMFERLIVGSKFVKSIGNVMPRPLLTLTIIMSSLPVAHWFGNPYLNGGMLLDYEECVLLIRQVSA